MKFLLTLFALFLGGYLYAVIRFAVHRIRFLAFLKQFTKTYGYSYKLAGIAYYFPCNRSKATILLETKNTVYNIRLFGLLRKHCEVHFWNLQEYSVEKHIIKALYVGSTPTGLTNAKCRRLGSFPSLDSSNNKTVIPVLLFLPTNGVMRLTRTQVNHLVELRAGDKIEDVLFADSDYLFRCIANRE